MVGFELDLQSPDFQVLMVTNTRRVTPGKVATKIKRLFPDDLQ
jgi:hypothetical protein